jgi:hypothetical protein
VKNIAISLLLVVVLALVAGAAFAQAVPQYSLLDFEHRLSVGGRVYRSFDELPGVSGSYTSSWWAGIPAAYILTGAKKADGTANPLPLSLIAAVDVGLQGDAQRRIRGYVGITALFKSVQP